MKLLPSGPARTGALVRLVLALGALGALWWYQFGRTPAAPASSTSNSQARTQAPAGAAQAALPSPLGFDKIEPVADAPQTERNPFRFGVPPRPPAPPYTPPPVQATKPQPPPPPPGPPRIQLTLVGLIDWPFPDGSQRRRATLRDPSGVLFHVFEGDKFDGRYRVIKVAVESVIVSYLDGTGQITLGVSRGT